MSDLDAIAAEFQVQFDNGTPYEALIPHLAETVEVRHHPDLQPGDGPIAGSEYAELMRGEHLRSVMPDERQIAEKISVDGDVITAAQRFVGTLVDGTKIDMPLSQTFTFADGKLAAIDHYTDPADTADLMAKVGKAMEALQAK